MLLVVVVVSLIIIVIVIIVLLFRVHLGHLHLIVLFFTFCNFVAFIS